MIPSYESMAKQAIVRVFNTIMTRLEQDVSGQVHDVPVVGHVGDVHLVLNFDYEVPSEPGSDGAGFDVDVDDWDDVNMDIVL